MKAEFQSTERFEDAIELLRIADDLNFEMFSICEVSPTGIELPPSGVEICKSEPFRVHSVGQSCCIEFLGYPIWNNQEDERKFDEDSEEYLETIEDYVRRRSVDYMNMLARIGQVFSAKTKKDLNVVENYLQEKQKGESK